MTSLSILAHAGHNHDLSTASVIDHCMPIIIGAGILIIILSAALLYVLTNWQPKKPTKRHK